MRNLILTLLLLISLPLFSQNCKTPQNLSVTGLSTTSATILWDLSAAGDVPESYFFKVSTTSGTVVFLDSNLVLSVQSYTLTNLTASTTYNVEISSTCSLSGISETVMFTFTTPCGSQNAPYTEDFNAAAPSCVFTDNATWSNGGRTGKCMALSTTTTSSSYIVFPELNLSSNDVEAAFWMKPSSVIGGDVTVYVGIVTDPSDVESTFEQLYTGTLSATTWTEVRMNTSATSQPLTSSTMIAVFIPSASHDCIIYLDDASIHAIPSCIRPEDFAVTNITATSALFSWSTTNASDVRIYVSSIDDTRTVIASTNPYTISNLVPNSDYSFQVRAICSASDSSELNPNILNIHTECVTADSALFLQTFESLTVPNSLPDCWKEGWLEKPADNTKVYPFAATTDRAHSGSRSMALLQQSAGSVAYLTSQALPIDQSGAYTLSVWVYRQEASATQSEGLKFWVSPNQYDTTGATLLGYIPRHYLAAPAENLANEWYNYEFVINTSGTRYIIVEGISENGAAVCFDDLAVRLTPSCFKASGLTLGTPTHNSLPLSWTPGMNGQQWIVSYSLNDGATISDTLSSPSCTIQNLSPATTYSIEGTVTSVCGVGDVSEPLFFYGSFVTSCEPLSFLPYSCGFEAEELTSAANPLPLCWSRLNDATGSDNTHPQASTSTSYSHTGTGYLKFLPVTSSVDYGEHQVAVLPQLNTSLYPIANLRLIFYGQATTINPAPVVTVGVMTDPTDLSTFVPVDSFTVGTTTYLRYEARFASYTGTGSYIALLSRRVETSFLSLNIDDIRLEPVPSCADLDGAGVAVSDVTDSRATLTVTDLTATTWSFAYGTAGTPLSACTVVDTVNGTSILLNNLSPNTSYVVYARRRCGTLFGSWSGAVTFKTACGAFPIPYSDGFESYSVGQLSGCYHVTTDADYLNVFADQSGFAGTYNHTASGSKGLSTSYSSTSSSPTGVTGNVTMAVYLSLTAGESYEISVYAHTNSNNEGYKLSFLSGTTTSDLTLFSTTDVISTAWTRYVGYFTPQSTGNYFLGLRTTSIDNVSDYAPFLDDLHVNAVSCIPPTDAFVSQLGSSSANVVFTSTGTSWDVAVSSTPINISGTVTGNIYRDTISTNSFSVSGLSVNTTYYYTIRTICPEGASDWMTPRSFHTRCTTASVPYTEGFESSAAVSCWSTVAGSVSRETTLRNSGSSSMKATAVTAVSPEFNVTSFAPYFLTGWAYSTTDSAVLSIGVMNDPDDATSMEIITSAVISPANTWVEVASYFTLLNDPEYAEYYNARHLALITGNSTIYLDDLNLDLALTCNRPTQGIVSNITGNSVTVDWTENGTATSWLVSAVNSYGVGVSQVVNTHPYTLTGLNPATSYSLYLRSICTATDTSLSYKVGEFTTACDYVTAPYTETFESFPVSSTPQCWDISGCTRTYTYNNHPEYLWGIYTYAGNKSSRLYNSRSSSGDASLVSPEVVLPTGGMYDFRFDYCHQASCGPLYVGIRRKGETAFTNIATLQKATSSDDASPVLFLTHSYGLQAYVGDTVQFQFSCAIDYGSGSIWLDNVKVRSLSSCSEISTLSVQDITASSLTIAFSDTSTTHNLWQYAVLLRGHDVSEATPVDVTSKYFTIPALTPSTDYDIYIRAVCSPGDYSTWNFVSAKTLALPATLPYITDFSDANQNKDWTAVGSGVNEFAFGSDSRALFATGSHALYVSDNGSNYNYDMNTQSITGIARLFSFAESTYSVEFDWKCSGGESVSDFGRFYLAPASGDLLPTYTSTFLYRNFSWPDNIIALDGDSYVNLREGGAQHLSEIVDMTGRAGDYYLVFIWANDASMGANYPLSVGNLSVSELTCEPVVNLAVDENTISYNSFTASCNNPNVGSDLRWVVSTSSLVSDSVIGGVSQSETFTVNGLSPSTMYHLFVRAECSALDRSPWTSVSLVTECAPVTSFPLFESFEGQTFPPVCWTATTLTSVTTSFGVVNGRWEQASRNTHSGSKSAAFEGDQTTSALLSTPAIHLEADREYHVSFWLMQSGSSWNDDEVNLYVGTDATTTAGATQLAHYVIYNSSRSGNSLAFFDVDLPIGLSGDYYIMFEAIDVTNGYIYLDDVTVGIYPPCRNLTTLPTVVATTATTASLNLPIGARTSLKFGIAPYSASPQTSAIFATQTTTTGDVTFTGLTPGTSYSVFVRGFCADGDSTSWTSPVTVVTKADDCFAPENLHVVGNISDVAATIAWNTVPDAVSYQCIITDGTSSDTAVVTSPQVTFSSLTSNTDYTLMVRGFCGPNDSTSQSSFSFRTITTPATLPYVTGFEATDDNPLWQKLVSGYANNFLIGYDSEGHCSGSRGLFISSDGRSYSQSVPSNPTPQYGVSLYNVTYYTRTIYFPAAGNYEVSYDWKCNAASGLSYEAYGRAFLAPVTASLPIDNNTYARNLPEGSYPLGSNLDKGSNWQRNSSIVTLDAPQYMNLVFMWIAINGTGYADPDDASDTPLAIDNVSVSEVACLPVSSIVALSVADTSATILVSKPEPATIEYALSTTYSTDSLVIDTLISTSLKDTLSLTGLSASTGYYLFVRQACTDSTRSSWKSLYFRTTATPAVVPYICGFEDDDENANWSYTQAQTNAFTIGTATSFGGTHSLYITNDGSTYAYDNTALSFAYAHRNILLPAGLYEYSFDWQCNGENNDDGGRVFLIPADVLLFERSWLYGLSYTSVPKNAIALDNRFLYGSTAYSTISGSFTVPEDKLYNIVVAWRSGSGSGSNPPLSVDNISIDAVSCLPPQVSVIASSVGETSASVAVSNVNENSSLVYALSSSSSLADAIYYDTLAYAALDTINLTALSASSSYYIHVRSLCAADDQSYWTVAQFKTLCGVVSVFPYVENFENLTTSTGYVANAANSFCWSSLYASSSKPYYNITSAQRYQGSASLRLVSSNTVPLYMLLPEMTDLNSLYLTFRSKYSNASSAAGTLSAGYLTDPEDGSTFVSLLDVSRTTSWAAQSVIFNDIPAGARMAFRYSGANANTFEVFIDAVRVSSLVDGPVYYDTICSNTHYLLHGFSVSKNTIVEGDNTFTRVSQGTTEGASDTLIVAHVHRLGTIQADVYDTICGGQPYTRGSWNITSPTSRDYQSVIRGGSHYGCDSTTVLHLTVIPVSHVITDSICHGDSYAFGDTVITDPGLYTRSYPSTYGCTVTDTLYLMVLPDSVFDVASVCANDLPYIWRGQSITTAGRHTLQITGPLSCPQTAVLDLTVLSTDSTVVLNICQGGSAQVADTIITTAGSYTLSRLDPVGGCFITYHVTATVTPLVPEDVYDYACEGYNYTGHGIINLPVTADTVVTVRTRTADARCDSMSNVHITFIPTVYTHIYDTIQRGSTYRFNGTDITEPGDYNANLHTAETNCDSIVTLHLTVIGTSVDNVSDVRVELVPNPVTAGSVAYIYGDFHDVVSVEVLNSLGQIIDTFVPDAYPIALPAISTSGLYHVRLTTSDGTLHLRKLIVK